MALIPCSECGTKISSNAESCPFCGNPMKEKDQESATYVHKAVRFLDDKLYFMKSDPTDV